MNASPWVIELGREGGAPLFRDADGASTYSAEAAQRYRTRRGASLGLHAARNRAPWPDARVMTLEQARSERAATERRRHDEGERRDIINMLRRVLHMWKTNARPSQSEADAMQAALDKMRGEP